MPRTRSSENVDVQSELLREEEAWQPSDGILFSVFSSMLLWSLIVVGVHATLS